MNAFRDKAQGRTKEIIGQMIGDDALVREGQEQERKAEKEAEQSSGRSKSVRDAPRH